MRQILEPYIDRPSPDPGPTAGGAVASRWVSARIPIELYNRFAALASGAPDRIEIAAIPPLYT